MGESTDIFTPTNVQGTGGMEPGCRDTSGRLENDPGAHKISLVFGMHASAHTHKHTLLNVTWGGLSSTKKTGHTWFG